MQRAVTQYKNNIRYRIISRRSAGNGSIAEHADFIPLNTKMLAFALFLVFFFEAGTIGILPKGFYLIYRNVRISDLILYPLIIYSLFCVKEYSELFSSKSFIIVKILFAYMIFQFIISFTTYHQPPIEYFFRMKMLWLSFLVFPFMLLLKRKGFGILIKIIIPFSIFSNIMYIISALSGVALLPDTHIVQQSLPGGLQVWRVYGGTFFGEFFLVGFIFYWNEYKFKIIHLPFFILFGLPHLLAFGRGTWIFISFTISFIIVWSSYRKHNIKSTIRQAVMLSIAFIAFIYAFRQFIPEAQELSESIGARIEQGQEDYKYGEGTIASRVSNQKALLELWLANPVFGIGMHPFWTIKPVTTQEAIYSWGFNDLQWVSVLVAYGAIGLILAIIFQLYYLFQTFRLLKKIKLSNVNYFFLIMFFVTMLRDSMLGYMFTVITVNIYALGKIVALYIANIVYLYEKLNEQDS